MTEFVPVSSSGHLVLLHEWLPLQLESELAFDVALHAGTLVAIVLYFSKDIIQYLQKTRKMIWFMILSSVPAGIAGFLLESLIDTYLRSAWIVVVMLVLVAIVFFYIERYSTQTLPLEQISLKHAMYMGLAQIMALIPGTSRSGITMSVGMLLGLQRAAAARFSFLMAIPIMTGATLKKFFDLAQVGMSRDEVSIFIIGAAISAVTGLVVIRYLLQFFQNHTLRPFAWYRIALAAVVIVVILL